MEAVVTGLGAALLSYIIATAIRRVRSKGQSNQSEALR